MLRKRHGKKNLRRKYCEESSAPKRRKIGEEEYKELKRPPEMEKETRLTPKKREVWKTQ